MGYRTLSFTIVNSTDQDLKLSSDALSHGKWSTEPTSISKGETMKCEASSKDGALIGTAGIINFLSDQTNGAFDINFDKPMGAGGTTINVSSPSPYLWTKDGDGGGHDGSTTITFTK